MQITRITTAAELESLAGHWNRLAGGVPMRRHEWLATWWRHYGQPHELYTLCVRDSDSRLAGIAPWYLQRSASEGRALRFLGSGEVCSDYQSLLVEPGRESEVTSVLADWLVDHRNERRDAWDLLHLSGVAADDLATRALAERLAGHGCQIHQSAGPNCWRLALPGDWQTYLASLSKSHRKQVRRLEERCFGTGRAVLRTVERADDLPRGLKILTELHQRRRQALGESGCFASPAFAAFHAEAMQRLLAAESLRLHWLELDGQPVAAEYHLAGGGVVYGYQAGVDPQRLDDEPGRLAAIATLKLAIEQGYQAFDFLRGDEPYKAHWRAEPRPSIELRIVPRRASARLRHTVWLAREQVRRLVRGSAAVEASASPATRRNGAENERPAIGN